MSTLSSPHPQSLRKTASIRNLPVNLFASVMGIAGLSIAWRQASQQFGVSSLMGEAAGILALIGAILALVALPVVELCNAVARLL